MAALAGIFNVSVPSGGIAGAVNVGQYNANPVPADVKAAAVKKLLGGRFISRHAPSLRAIYDLGDLESSQFIYQTGQSGLALSGRYGDMSQGMADGRYRNRRCSPRAGAMCWSCSAKGRKALNSVAVKI